MNTQTNHHNSASVDAFGQIIASRLSDSTDALPHEITERLKVARTRAVARRRIVSAQTQLSVTGTTAALQMGGGEEGLWNRIASFIPLIALVAGLISIAVLQDEKSAAEIAEIDAELLIDELPPQAYVDPGFAHYLHVNRPN